jgi:hypothetical protein
MNTDAAWLFVRAIQESNPALGEQGRQRAYAAERLIEQLNKTGK